jgi:hypothetical protein
MTFREALKAKITNVPDITIDLVLAERGLDPVGTYQPTNDEHRKPVDLAHADAILYLVSLPETVKQLDYQLTHRDVDGLLKLRSSLLSKWGESDYGGSEIKDISNLH